MASAAGALGASYTVTDIYGPAGAGPTPGAPVFTTLIWGGGPIPDGTVKLEVPTFDGSLGTLAGVSIEVIGGFRGELKAVNSGTSEATEVKVNATGFIVMPDFTLAQSTVIPEFGDAVFDPPVSDGFYDIGTIPPLSTALSPLITETSSTTLDGFDYFPAAWWTDDGVSWLDFPVGAFASTSGSGNGGDLTTGIQNGQANVTLNVTYFYNDAVIPEPGTYVAGLALLGMGVLGYRRMRRA